MVNYQVCHERTKNNNIHFHFIRYTLKSNNMVVHKVASEYNLADVFTKVMVNLLASLLGVTIEGIK